MALLSLVLIAGCRPKSTEPQPAITGAFGFDLGGQADSRFELFNDNLRYSLSEPEKPFTSVYVTATAEGKIESIQAMAPRDYWQQLFETLRGKYGTPAQRTSDEVIWIEWARKRSIMLMRVSDFITLDYSDNKIREEERRKQSDVKRQEVQKVKGL